MRRDAIGGRKQKVCICKVARSAREDVDDFPKY